MSSQEDASCSSIVLEGGFESTASGWFYGSMHYIRYVGEKEKHGERLCLDAVVDHTRIREEEFLFLVIVFDPHSIIECSVLFSAYRDVMHSSETDE